MAEKSQKGGSELPIGDQPSPDIQALVAKAVADALPGAVALAIAEMGKSGAAPAEDALHGFARQMAETIAELADQGTNRKRVAPEILARRAAAAERMDALIRKAQEEGKKAEYRVVSKVYLNERLIEPFRRVDKKAVPQDIVWSGPPSDALRPLNAVADEIFQAYRESIGSTTKLASVTRRDANGAIGVAPAPDTRPHWITPGGLVVKGDAPARSVLAEPKDFADDLTIQGTIDPNAPFVHILGTIAKPAQQNMAEVKT
jgi:hypothetical protein